MKKHLLIVMALLSLSAMCFAQGRTVTGKVTSEEGDPIPGASVVVKGTTSGSVTDANGSFTLNVPQGSTTLVITFIGYKTVETEIGSNSIIDVQLQQDAKQLSEVVITGYSTQNKREVSGSVATLKGAEVSSVPIGSFDQALQGKVPGLLIQAQSGQPGAAASVIIRGKGSILGSNTPLYIVDGIEITAGDFATLNPNDFESISVLKDAISTSQYGSRGANGVIVITTKKGKGTQSRLTYDIQYGLSKAPHNKLKLMNSNEKLDYELANGNDYGWTNAEVDSLRQIDTDWEDVFFQTGKTQSHSLSYQGSADKTNYFLSGSIFDQTGTVPTTLLKRYTGRMNIETTAGDFNFGINSSFGVSNFTNTTENNSGIQSPLNALRWLNPYENVYDANGNYTKITSGQPHPLQELLENTNLRKQLKGIGNVFVVYNVPFVKGLMLKTNWGGDFTSNETSAYVNPTTAAGASSVGGAGSLTRGYNKRFRYTGTTSISYTADITTDHRLSVGLYNEVINDNSTNFAFTGYGMRGAFENEAGITPGTPTNNYIPAVGGGGTENALLSYFTLIHYGFRDKYFLDVSVRRDGSSRFGRNKRYATFGSVGASWILSDEAFMSGLKENIFNELKFKVSYGSAGNQSGIGSFEARELYGRAVYNGAGGLLQTQLENPDLQWEKKTTFNTGFEITSLNGRIRSTIEYYNSLTTDLFLNRQLSRTSGFESISTNVGELQNSGVELFLEADVLKINDFIWTLNASLTKNNNKIKKLVGEQKEQIGGLTITKVGEKLNSIYVVRYAGVNPDNGNAQYYNINGEITETFSAADRVIVGSYEAPYFGGFGSTMKFKGIELSAFFSYVMGNQLYNNDRTNVEDPTYLTDNISRDLLREWRQVGDITDIPRPAQTMQRSTTRFVEDGDFLRLRNVMLSYSLPKSLVSKVKLNGVKIYAQGQNLMTWTDFRGFDPEISTGSLTGAQYPALRTVTFGLNVGL